MNTQVLLTVLMGGVAALDATPVAQTLLFQPLVTGTLLGLLWHDLALAIPVAIVLQLVAASTQPVGARTPEDYAAGGVVGVGVALALASQIPYSMARESCQLLGVLAGLVTALAGVPLVKWQRRRNEGLARWCEAEVREGHEGALLQAHLAGATLALAVGAALCSAALGLFVWTLRPLVFHESVRLARGWELAQPVWIGLGLAQVLHGFLQRRLARVAVFGAALFGAWLLLLLGGR